MQNNKFNKKAQIGETLTWGVATLIVIGILIVFLFFSSVLATKTKILNIDDVKSDVEEKSPVLSIKTALAHYIAEDRNSEIINKILEEKND